MEEHITGFFFGFQMTEHNTNWNCQCCQVDLLLKKFMGISRLLLISRKKIDFM